MDALSDILRAVNLHDAGFVDVRLGAPWQIRTPEPPALRDQICPGSDHLLLYHFVVEGECAAWLPGGERCMLKAGDAVVMPRADAHVLASSGDTAAPAVVDMQHLLRAPEQFTRDAAPARSTRLICGYMTCDPWLGRTIFDVLPRMIAIDLRADAESDWIERAVWDAVRKVSSLQPGARGVLAKVSELLIVQVLTRAIREVGDVGHGWVGGLRDPIVGRSLAVLHQRPAFPWTVENLARTVGASRSVLAERFRRLVGQPPMQYLAKWRMALAADYLRRTPLSLMRIAEEVGYDTGTAFHRAFVREFGVPPARWRRQQSVSFG